jgi:hypothetical protein
VRAGERKLETKKAGRKNELKNNKPPKDELEKCLLKGMSVYNIAIKYDAGKSTVSKWIHDYGLQGVKRVPGEDDVPPEITPLAGRSRKPGTSGVGVAMPGPPMMDQKPQDYTLIEPWLKPAIDKSLHDIAQTIKGDLSETIEDAMGSDVDIMPKSVIPEIIQGSPSLAEPSLSEIEKFHTDIGPLREFPNVGMGPVTPIATMMASQIMSEVTEMQPSEPQPAKPLAITMEPEAADPAPRETIDEILQDACSKLVKLERLHVAETENLFRKKLRALFTNLVNELDGKY